jgi:pimeloyl-ACP methyl ester carboxylesterase
MRRFCFAATCVIFAALFSSVEQGDSANPGLRGKAPGAQRVKTIRVRGAEFAYVEQGRGEPVVFVHGSVEDYRVWSAQVAELSKHYRVIAYSRRYHYPNAWAGDGSDYTPSLHAADLVALIKALNLRLVHLVGHSYGAFVAALVARDQPELVRSLVLAEPPMMSLLAQNPEAQSLPPATFLDDAHQAFQQGDMEGGLRIFLGGAIGKGTFDQLTPTVRRIVLDNARGIKAQLSAPRSSFLPAFTCDDAQHIQAPTLLVVGERSPKAYALVIDELQKCLPHSERAVVPRSSHGVEYENPAAFNEIVLKFLTSNSTN